MGSPQILLIKISNDDKLDKYCVKIKLRRDSTPEKLYLYELKMTFFDNGKPEDFLLFRWNFQLTLQASGTLSAGAKI